MWPILFDGKFLTIIQVDKPQKMDGHWEIHLLDIRGGIHRALYRHVGIADVAYKAFRDFACRPRAQRGLCLWQMDRDELKAEEIQES